MVIGSKCRGPHVSAFPAFDDAQTLSSAAQEHAQIYLESLLPTPYSTRNFSFSGNKRTSKYEINDWLLGLDRTQHRTTSHEIDYFQRRALGCYVESSHPIQRLALSLALPPKPPFSVISFQINWLLVASQSCIGTEDLRQTFIKLGLKA